MSRRQPSNPNAQMELPVFQPVVTIPAITIPQGDGTYLVKPGRPVVMEQRVTTQRAAEILGLSRRHIQTMCIEGKLQVEQPGGPKGKYFITLQSILARKGPPSD